VLFIAQCNQQTEGKWQEVKDTLDEEVKQNPTPENLKQQAAVQRVLDTIIHIY
jgi:hypothetical protein